MTKPRIIKDYENLPDAIIEQVKLVYPRGFSEHLISFKNLAGETRKGLRFETDDKIYLIRMTLQLAEEIIDEDHDYNDDGVLRPRVRERYENKYDDADYLDEYNSNDDNDFGE